MRLIMGSRAVSSWSMRPWLALKRAGAAFDETLIALRRADTAERIAACSPTGKVPVLVDGPLVIADSLAICEYLAERFPDAVLWPADPVARALGRSAVAEMHAGFSALRRECPMELALAPARADLSDAVAVDVARIVALWRELRGRFAQDGPFLLGRWSIVDAFYTPVATRFQTYGVDLAGHGDDGSAAAVCEAMLQSPEYLQWRALALAQA